MTPRIVYARDEAVADFRKLFAESMVNDGESCFLGKDNWGLYLGELQGNLDELAETAYVAYLEETPVGYVVASQNETDWMYLSEIYVSRPFRGQQLAEKMLRLVLEMNGCHHVHAYVHEGNVAMQKTLSRMGGSHAGKWYDYCF